MPPEDSDCTSDLSQWFHCSNNKGIPDEILARSWDITRAVSFVFHHRSSAVATELPKQLEQETKECKKETAYLSDDELFDDDDKENDNSSDEDFTL